MAGSTVRPPQEQLNQYQTAIEFISSIQEIVRNPDVHKNINKTSEALLAAQALSDTKRQELEAAEATISKSQQFLDKFEKQKLEQEEEVNAHYEKIAHQKEILKAQTEAIQKENTAAKLEHLKMKQDAEDSLKAATKTLEEANLKHTAAQKLESLIQKRETIHAENTKSFEMSRNDTLNNLNKKLTEHEANVQKFNEEYASFKVKKKKLEAALSGE